MELRELTCAPSAWLVGKRC